MNLADYKTQTLARTDVDDIVMIEPVEKRPVKDALGVVTGYEVLSLTTESGKTVTKYDIHLMRVVDGLKKFDKEQIAIVNEGQADEEVVFRAPTTEPKAVSESQIETYVKSLPYYEQEILTMDTAKPSVLFKALKIAAGVATWVQVYAYRDPNTNKPTYVEITN